MGHRRFFGHVVVVALFAVAPIARSATPAEPPVRIVDVAFDPDARTLLASGEARADVVTDDARVRMVVKVRTSQTCSIEAPDADAGRALCAAAGGVPLDRKSAVTGRPLCQFSESTSRVVAARGAGELTARTAWNRKTRAELPVAYTFREGARLGQAIACPTDWTQESDAWFDAVGVTVAVVDGDGGPVVRDAQRAVASTEAWPPAVASN